MTNFVLVHAAFVDGSYWRDVAALLERAGDRVDVVGQLPSVGIDAGSLGERAEALGRVLGP